MNSRQSKNKLNPFIGSGMFLSPINQLNHQLSPQSSIKNENTGEYIEKFVYN